MSDNVDETRPAEQGNVNTTLQPASDIDSSQLYDMFMKIEQRLPNFDHMLMAMNDYAFRRTLRQRQTNDLSEFCGVLKKGFFAWYTSSNKINNLPDFIDLINEVFDDDISMKFDKKLVSSTSPNADTDKCIQTSNITDASESTNTNANADAIKITDTSANTDAIKITDTSANTDACKSTHTSANTDASECINTGDITDISESTKRNANTDGCKSTHTRANTDASECINTGDITDISESTKINANTDSIKSTVTSPNTDACKGTHTNANTDASESTNIITNANVRESTSTSTNVDASKSTLKNVNTCSHKSASTCTNKRVRMSMSSYSVMMATNTKYSSKHLRTTKALEAAEELKTLSQSTEQSTQTKKSTRRMDRRLKIIMPEMYEENILIRKRLPIDRNIHLGMDFERHWWRQTNDKIVLNVDISDLIWDSAPNIKVVVSIIGFNIRIKRSNRWVVLISNEFIKPISKAKWVVNEHMHVKLTMNKREREFWGKCLVTETREHVTSFFGNHICTKECAAPIIIEEPVLPLSPSKERCLKNLTDFLKRDYGMDDEEFQDDFDPSTVTNSPTKEE